MESRLVTPQVDKEDMMLTWALVTVILMLGSFICGMVYKEKALRKVVEK